MRRLTYLTFVACTASVLLPGCHRCEGDDCDTMGSDPDFGDDDSDDDDDDDDAGEEGCSAYGSFDWSAPPSVTWDAQKGATVVTAQFVPRDADCAPLLDGQFAVRPYVDGVNDPEHAGDSSGDALPVDLHLILVLDASYSMVARHAWEPMIEAASTTLRNAVATWQTRPGELTFEVVWFNSFVFRNEGDWTVDDLAGIPVPDANTNAFTKLYAAVNVAKQQSDAAYSAGIATGSQDHHQIVVFTDGDDNHSYFPNGTGATGTTSTGANFVEIMLDQPVDVDLAVAALSESQANLTAHVIALSGQIQHGEALDAMATAGGGKYLARPGEAALGQLFADVMNEFISLQNVSITTPLGMGQHRFELRYQGLGQDTWTSQGYSSRCFRFEAGPAAMFLGDGCS